MDFLYTTLLTYLTFTFSNLFNNALQYITNYLMNIFEHHFSASVTVYENYSMFEAIQDHVTLYIDQANLNRLDFSGKTSNKLKQLSETKGLLFVPADKNTCKIQYNGYTIQVKYNKASGNDNRRSDNGGGRKSLCSHLELKIYGLSPSNLRKILIDYMNMCLDIHTKNDTSEVKVNIGQYDQWNRSLAIPLRPIQSVVIPESVKTPLLDDIQEFLDSSAWYLESGYKHRRGYLFHGPPGCGKSSAIYAIASRFQLSISRVLLSDCRLSDVNLMCLIQGNHPNSILLIEDVDAAFAKRTPKLPTPEESTGVELEDAMQRIKRKSAGEFESDGVKITLSGLLNALDCMGMQEKQIVIMTTNHIEHLDEALIRPGRIDVRVHFDLLKAEDAVKMFRIVYSRKSNEYEIEDLAEQFKINLTKPISGAVLQNYLLQRRHDPHRAISDVEQLWNNPNFELQDKSTTVGL